MELYSSLSTTYLLALGTAVQALNTSEVPFVCQMLIKCAAAIILVCALIAHATDLDIEHKDETIGSATTLVSTDPVPGPESSHRGATDSEDDSKPTSVLEPTEQLGEEASQEEVITPKGEWYLGETKEDATNLDQKDVPQEDMLGDGVGAALGDGDGAGLWRRRRRRYIRRRRRSAANERRKRAATQAKINRAERKQNKINEANMRKDKPKLQKKVDRHIAAAVPITRFKCSSFLESPDKWIVSLSAKEEEEATRTRTTSRTLLGSDRRRAKPPAPAPPRPEPTTFVLVLPPLSFVSL